MMWITSSDNYFKHAMTFGHPTTVNCQVFEVLEANWLVKISQVLFGLFVLIQTKMTGVKVLFRTISSAEFLSSFFFTLLFFNYLTFNIDQHFGLIIKFDNSLGMILENNAWHESILRDIDHSQIFHIHFLRAKLDAIVTKGNNLPNQ